MTIVQHLATAGVPSLATMWMLNVKPLAPTPAFCPTCHLPLSSRQSP